jgi:ferric iron reductase protein FhuF
VANIPLSILWENTAVRIFSLYEKRFGHEGNSKTRERIEGDFAYVITGASGSLFGEKENPLTRFFVASEKPVRFRKTCCFYYRISADGSCCSICPKAKAEMQKRCN